MRKLFIAILVLCFTFSPIHTFAENDFFGIVKSTLNEITDCSNKQLVQLSASGYDPDACILFIDYTEGNYSIVGIDDQAAMVIYPFEEEELAICIIELLLQFDSIEELLPNGRYLQYDLKLSENNTYHITKDNVSTLQAN